MSRAPREPSKRIETDAPAGQRLIRPIIYYMNQYEEIENRALNAKTLDDSAEVLAFLLSHGFSVWTDGQIYNVKQLVARVDGIKIEVFSREHPPPHFHIEGGGIDATFSIIDCSLIDGRVSGRERALIEWWYTRSRSVLVQAWNNSRPSDCPVGPINE